MKVMDLDLRGSKTADEATLRRKAIIAVIVGNGFEWFDFTVYSFFAVTIGRLFFPTGNDLTSLLLSVATFGVGFFMRPVGGVMLGIYADKVGRKAALSLTILLMTVATTMIGFAPTYREIGIWAPIIIVMARLLQGFSAGGEMGGATAFLTEYAPAKSRGYYSSWIQASIGVAVVLGAALGVCLSTMLSVEDLEGWGWRVPFLLGLLIGPIGFYIRNRIAESSAFEAVAGRTKTPFREVLRNYRRETLTSFGLVILWTVCSYVLLFYIPTYSVKILKLPPSTGFIALMVGGLMVLVLTPIFGALSDRFGRRIFMSAAAALILILAYPMFTYINASPGLYSLIVFQLVFGLLISVYEGPILAVFSEI
ncbi:MFS transporter, partial [Collimonas sp.]|uniref:MFS transporter n=1 Tax=Collimonas sp. TaxID=1963772 RepID=UPI002C1B73B8